MKSFVEFIEEKGLVVQEAKWLAGAIKHPGRCKVMGSKECPKGSPQYKLAQRLKSSGDLYKGKKNKKVKKK